MMAHVISVVASALPLVAIVPVIAANIQLVGDVVLFKNDRG